MGGDELRLWAPGFSFYRVVEIRREIFCEAAAPVPPMLRRIGLGEEPNGLIGVILNDSIRVATAPRPQLAPAASGLDSIHVEVLVDNTLRSITGGVGGRWTREDAEVPHVSFYKFRIPGRVDDALFLFKRELLTLHCCANTSFRNPRFSGSKSFTQ